LIDRHQARVQVLGVWWEDGVAPRHVDGFVDAMHDALGAYLRLAAALAASSGRPISRRRRRSSAPTHDAGAFDPRLLEDGLRWCQSPRFCLPNRTTFESVMASSSSSRSPDV